MLSYRHAYHAGNCADVLKHLVIERILNYLVQKPKPCFYLDTHAGAGLYALDADIANKTAEYHHGVSRILSCSSVPVVMQNYIAIVNTCRQKEGAFAYPGSPWLAAYCLRDVDRLAFCELHPQDAPMLQENFQQDSRTNIYPEDGFIKSLALLPPIQRRGLTVIDPSYELKADYDKVVEHVKTLYKRFATGVYAVWYPVVNCERVARLEAQFKRAGLKNTHLYELQTYSSDKGGMYASGMIVVNPPWTLKQDLEVALPWLVDVMGLDSEASFRSVILCPE